MPAKLSFGLRCKGNLPLTGGNVVTGAEIRWTAIKYG